MKQIFRELYHAILKRMPDIIVVNIENLMVCGRLFNKRDVKYFGEKIQYLKLYGNLEKYSDFSDKYKVREYVSSKIGKEYLIPLLGVYNKPEEINYSALPNKFVLKANHGCGYNIIVRDKDNINVSKINKKLAKWLKEDYYKIKKEYQYKDIERKIICEEFISDENDKLLDYKFFCFDGNPEFLAVYSDRNDGHEIKLDDLEWNDLNLKETKIKNYKGKFEKPENFEKMIEISKRLSKDFQFVRVDLYNVSGKIYFGELTFTHASGKRAFRPKNVDMQIAEKIKI